MNKGATKRVILGALSILLVASAAFAADVPLRNWRVPSGELSKLDHFTGTSAIFAPFEPCRLEDSRVSNGGAGPIGSGVSGGTRDYDFVPGGGNCASTLPSQVVALSLNFTIVGALGNGFLYAFPQGGAAPPVSILNYVAGDTKSNAAIVPVNPANGAITVGTGVSGTDVIIDINGVFYNDLANADHLVVTTTRPGSSAILGQNNSTSAGSHGIGGFATAGVVHGVQGQVGSTALGGASGVHGINDSGAGVTWGVFGEITPTSAGASSAGVRGENHSTTSLGIGVWGSHAGSGWGVRGAANGTTGAGSRGVYGTSASSSGNASGVYGVATSTVGGSTFGVYGESNSGDNGAAGVEGVIGNLTANSDSHFPAGVRGDSTTFRGVLGVALTNHGVFGRNVDTTGSEETNGGLGCSATVAVCGDGNLSITGTKSFLDPHPSDPAKVIRYVALEGPEAGTYFRGRGRFRNGLAVIDVPESFRLVTDEEGLGVQITPIGEMATVAILRADLNQIVVKGSRNVEFYYTVNGVRASFPDFEPIQQHAGEFLPDTPDGTIVGALSPEQKRRLIANGTFKEDGKVNKDTAKALGWDKRWEKPAAKPAPADPQEQQEE